MSQYGYLAHHGIKGQKWGIRRFQNENGTLTPEGMARYGYVVKAPNKDLSKLSDSKKFRIAKRSFIKDLYTLGWKSDKVGNDLARLREQDDLKEWGKNKEFKNDMKKAYDKYVKYEKDGNHDFREYRQYQKELLAPLYEKYPKAKYILNGIDFRDSFGSSSNNPFNSKEQTLFGDNPSKYMHDNWIRSLWNHEYHYDAGLREMVESTVIEKAATSAMTQDYIKIYGKDIVDKLWKSYWK